MIRRLSAVATFIVCSSVIAPQVHAQSFTQACGGSDFFSCVTLSVASSNGGLTRTFTVRNVSNTGMANNPNSFFSLFGVGNGAVTPTVVGTSSSNFTTACSMSVTGCASTNINPSSFGGAGFSATNFFGLYAITPNRPAHSLHDGESVSFFLTFASSSAANSFVNAEQFALHDQGGLNECGSSKAVFSANGTPATGSASPTNAGSCNPTTTTPEPSSFALLGTGFIGLIPLVRRRRK